MKGKKVAGIVGDLVSTEAAFALKQLIEGLGGSVECRTDDAKLPEANRSGYLALPPSKMLITLSLSN